MRLKNPGGVDKAIEAVDQVRGRLADTHGGTSAHRKDAFLTWCDQWATPQLGNHFPASEGIFAEISDTYHRLSALPPTPERQLNGVISRQWQEWDSRPERVLAELRGLRGFLARPGRLWWCQTRRH